jgi:hypothetical protein
VQEPRCGTCHLANYAENTGTLFRNSFGHGGVMCEGCHNSTHADVPARDDQDNANSVALQGYAGPLKNCAVCHGVLGDGDSQVALNMSLRRPPSLHLYRDRPDGYIFQVISRGFGLMPSYAGSISVHDRWAVVAYVRALQLSQFASVDQLPAELRGRLEKETR